MTAPLIEVDPFLLAWLRAATEAQGGALSARYQNLAGDAIPVRADSPGRRTHVDAVMRRLYGIDAGEYKALLRAQGGACAICRRRADEAHPLFIDHNHDLAGRAAVRGLLCSICNTGLGAFRDNPKALERAIAYLSNPPAVPILIRLAEGGA